jgi:dicarboxylate/amino acid:cation (Na+ or H+) symporter, DAACS family
MSPRLSLRIMVGLLAGSALGVLAHWLLPGSDALAGFIAYVTEPLGKLFLRLLFMLVVPLIFCALVIGVAGLGDLRQVGRIGLLTFVYTVVVSSLAVLIGVGLVNLVRPGEGLGDRALELASAAPAASDNALPTNAIDFFLNLVPQNPVKAMADGDMLGMMVFALLFGIALVSVKTEPAGRLTEVIEGAFQTTMKLLDMVIALAPIGVACLLFTVTARLGYHVLVTLGAYVLVVIGGLLLQMVGVYSISVGWLGKMSPLRFFRAVRPAMLTAFSTSSSNATLPTALLVAEQNLKLPIQVSRFVLTLGSTANQNGTALFEGVTVLFLAQVAGVDLTLMQQVVVVGVCILGGIGTAGVPAGSLPVIVMILGMIGVPPDGIGIVLGVDRLLDMCRTTVNVTGDLAAAVVVSAQLGPEAGGEPGAVAPGE